MAVAFWIALAFLCDTMLTHPKHVVREHGSVIYSGLPDFAADLVRPTDLEGRERKRRGDDERRTRMANAVAETIVKEALSNGNNLGKLQKVILFAMPFDVSREDGTAVSLAIVYELYRRGFPRYGSGIEDHCNNIVTSRVRRLFGLDDAVVTLLINANQHKPPPWETSFARFRTQDGSLMVLYLHFVEGVPIVLPRSY